MSQIGCSISDQRISDWRNGRHFPKEFAIVEPLLGWLTSRAASAGHDDNLRPAEYWKSLWEERSEAVAEDTDDTASIERPFRGLASLTAQDSKIYFGRDDLVDELGSRISRTAAAGYDQPIVIVTGSSGAGKSSLLGAGLAKCENVSVRFNCRPASLPPGNLPPGGDTIAVLVVDQFEEVFTRTDTDPEDYVAALVSLARGNNLIVVIGVRADYFDRCVGIPALARAWQENCMIVSEMTDAQLRRIIVDPAKSTGGSAESGLAELMIADIHASCGAGERAGRLPLLAYVLQATWARRTNGRMTLSGYRATGGVTRAVADTAEQAWSAISEVDRPLAKSVLMALTYLGPYGRVMRSALTQAELSAQFPRRVSYVVDSFACARLVVANSERIEFVHDVVLQAWPRLRQWIEDDREAQVLRQEIDGSAREWVNSGHDSDFLFSPAKLSLAAECGKRHCGPIQQDSIDFLAESTRVHKRRQTLHTSAIVFVVVLALASISIAGVVFSQSRQISEQRNEARYQLLTSQIGMLSRSNPSLAADLMLVAHAQRPSDTSIDGKIIAAAGKPIDTPLSGHTGAVYGVAYNRVGTLLASASNDRTVRIWKIGDPRGPKSVGILTGFGSFVTSVAFDPIKPVLATGSGDGTARLWDISDPAHPRQLGDSLHPGHGTVYNVVFSPDGRTLATPSDDGTVTLWNVADPASPSVSGPVLTGHTGPVRTLAFSPNGAVLASGGDDRTVRLWNVSDPAHPAQYSRPITGFRSITHSVAFDPSGTQVAITGDGLDAQIWNVADPNSPASLSTSLPGNTAKSWSIAYGARPGTIASAGFDGIIRTWNTSDPAHPSVAAQLPAVSSVAPGACSLVYSPTGSEIAAGYADGTVRVWHLPDAEFVDRSSSVDDLSLDASGRLLATTGGDDSLHLLRLDESLTGPPRLLSKVDVERRVNDHPKVSVSPDGAQIATANNNGGRVQLWDSRDPTKPMLASDLIVDTRYTNEIAYSSKGHLLATGNSDTSIQLWNVDNPASPVRHGIPLVGPTDLITGVAFDPTGQVLAVSSIDEHVRIYDLESGRSDAVATIANQIAEPIVFSPQGHTLAVGDRNAVELWDLSDLGRIRKISTLSSSPVASLNISKDGQFMAVGTVDGRLLLDDISVPSNPRPFSDSLVDPDPNGVSDGAMWKAVFAVDGTTVIAAYNRGSTLYERNYDVSAAQKSICARIGSEPTKEEWEAAITDVPYQSPCSVS